VVEPGAARKSLPKPNLIRTGSLPGSLGSCVVPGRGKKRKYTGLQGLLGEITGSGLFRTMRKRKQKKNSKKSPEHSRETETRKGDLQVSLIREGRIENGRETRKTLISRARKMDNKSRARGKGEDEPRIRWMAGNVQTSGTRKMSSSAIGKKGEYERQA